MEEVHELMPFISPNGLEGVCRVEIIALKGGRCAVIVEELDDNPGQSVSLAWEAVVAKVCKKYGVDPAAAVWIEHNAEPIVAGNMRLERWQLVTFKLAGPGRLERRAEWRNMTPDDWHEIGLPPRE